MVAVTGPDRGGWPAWFFTAWAVHRAGGRPLRIRPARPHHHCHFDALIVGGGADVDPALYEKPDGPATSEIQAAERRWSQRLIGYAFYPLLWLLRRLFQSHGGRLDTERDRLEKALIHRALDERRPILGICRGMQLVNVVRGGTLHRDLGGFYTETPQTRSLLPVKRVDLEPGSRLAAVLDGETVQVNALHNHAVAELGQHLRVCGREPTGVIQAIEACDRWCIGVQWHPEYLPQKHVQQRLFRALVRAAGPETGAREPTDQAPAG
ncbi:Para-aminobenzoate synthase, amidotransferase component [Thioalkalivibrio nitratireducens DSM 14787]|uniref:Para-aminobenzoate synthase, amidotransferase component n=1 Tax=Thioalkalivibrio nitratireducens (strain DSM 14787 / UNIQEM 213 / ALEN2) TaxID=1255043 RepID=L0DRB7_THIND|nr:gamma-glutamyl-gamma-aminobutyrate hydrolase family protein [Thioalkalivibrio nitratireducens]AGA32134.1 Para-aminobenzoate synthase, amidotransferase component [Thioalkalivibrio nitratireducens DSM 14787]